MAEINKELYTLAISQRKQEKEKFSKEDYDKRVADWQLFYLNNLDIFMEEYLEVPLHQFQRQLFLDCRYYDIIDVITSRGLSKSFSIAGIATSLALLLPTINILITSFTLSQSNLIIKEKIDEMFSSESKGLSPLLKQLRKDGYITFSKDVNSGGMIVEFGNGSKIFAVNCGDSCRGKRSSVVIVDEARLIKKTDYDAIVEPTLEPYEYNGLKLEPKQVFLSSARTKDNWLWRHLRQTVTSHYKDKRIKYGFFAGDIFTAVANGIQTQNQYISRKKNTNDMDFEMEYLNIWLGENEDSLFKYEDFRRNQILEKAFYPPNTYEYLDGKYQTIFPDNEIRVLAVDIAISGGRENDNSVFLLGAINIEDGKFKRKVEYIKTANGMNSINQVLTIKRLFYDYQCTFCVIDTKGVGNVIYDMLSDKTYDDERGIWYDGWTVSNDDNLQVSSATIIADKRGRTIDKDAVDVIIPFVGTQELNSSMHISLRQALKDEKVELLKDDGEVEAIISETDKDWITRTSEYRAEKLIPYVQTRFLINEAVALVGKISGNLIKLEEKSSARTKDRYMTIGMFNCLCDKIATKYAKQGQVSDINWDEIQLTF